MTISPEQWTRITELFDAAQAVPPSEREALLNARAGDDAAVLRQTQQLLAHDQDDAFLNPRPRLPVEFPPRTSRLIGAVVGAYRIEREIGRGGMGVVYEARYVDPQFDRRVAIKTLPIGFDVPELQWRFRRERQILSRLEHPNIATLFDGGTTSDGVPYIVMEFVEGVRVDLWCERQQLSIAQRLDVFRQVCAAVQFAHAKLIVHRDLKPSNILVTAHGVVKLLDFGVAKLLTSAPDHDATEVGVAPLTTAYASPEQLRGDDATVSSDVYSLGVLLYRLLTGNAPFEIEGRNVIDVQQILITQTPRVPSEGVTDRHAHACGVGDARPIRAALKGDLDAIAMMALRHDPARRYASVDAFSADVLRYLKGQPVQARPEQLTQVLRSLVKRHRALAVASAITVFALVVATTISLRSAALARTEARRATRMVQMLESIVGAADPFSVDGLRLQGADISLRQVIDSARTRVARSLADEPRTRADLYRTLGNSYLHLDQLDLSRLMIDSATHLHTATLGARSMEVHADRISSALLDVARGDADRGLTALQALRLNYANGDAPADSGLVVVLVALAQLQLTVFLNTEGVVALLNDAIALGRARAQPNPAIVSVAEATLALAFAETGNIAASDSLILNATRRLAPDSLRSPAPLVYVFAFSGLAKFLRGQSAEAEHIWRRAHRFAVQVFGPLHPLTAETQSGLSWVLLDRRQYPEGRALIDSAIAVEQHRPHQNAGVMSGMYRLRMAYALAQQDTAAAESWRSAAQRELEKAGGQRPYLEVQLLWLTAALDVAVAHRDSAVVHLQRAANIAMTEIGPKHPLAVLAASRLAEFTARENQRKP